MVEVTCYGPTVRFWAADTTVEVALLPWATLKAGAARWRDWEPSLRIVMQPHYRPAYPRQAFVAHRVWDRAIAQGLVTC